MKLCSIFAASLCLLSTPCLAMFCPNNFNQINIGDTLEQVKTQCGKPDVEKTSDSTANLPQEWTYFMTIPNQFTNNIPANQGTMKVTFAFENDKAINITSNGLGVGATTICQNVNLQLGSSTADVEKACGKPAVINKTDLPGAAPTVPTTETIMWSYSGQNSATLIFVDGKLKERKDN